MIALAIGIISGSSESGNRQIILVTVLSVALYIFYQFLTVKYMIQSEEPPKSVRAAGMAEAAFGVLAVGPIWFIDNNKILLIFFLLLSLFWICVAVSLYKGSKIGRTICLVLSILRIPTIIGAFFSLFSLYKLYYTQESKDFFNR